MKKLLLIFTLSLMVYVHADLEDLLVLLPPQLGDIALIDEQPVETIHTRCVSLADGVVHVASYRDGVVKMVLTGPKISNKNLGVQRIFREGKEISKSKEYFLDADKPDTVIHVHKKYIVSTSPDKQVISPR